MLRRTVAGQSSRATPRLAALRFRLFGSRPSFKCTRATESLSDKPQHTRPKKPKAQAAVLADHHAVISCRVGASSCNFEHQRRDPAVQQQEPARLLPPGRGSARLGQAHPRGALDARRQRVGWLGMATGIWEALQMPIAVRIVLSANGHAEVSCATSDIGTGTYTIMTQVAADMLGLPLDSVTIKLGDSTLPQSPVEGGSWIAASVSNGIATTSDAVRKEVLRLAKQMPNSPLADAAPDAVVLADGKLVSKRDASRAVSIADAMRHSAVDRIEQEKSTTFADDGSHAHNTHSALFAEVKVDEQLGVIRVTRVVSAVAAGRILNTKTAHSQIMGSVVWGIGMALHEETLVDHKFGRTMNANIAEYHVPVNADVHDIKVIFVDEADEIINPLGIKGLGEIGIVGVAAAIANAIYHATGKRVRDLPITLDKLQR